jgi:Protein of unknown function (DUF3467)
LVQPPPQQPQPEIKLDTKDLKSSYCNVCSATSTNEEVVLNFGINQNWDLRQPVMDVALHHRIIMSPAAAKRFHGVLTQLLADHQARHGMLTSFE